MIHTETAPSSTSFSIDGELHFKFFPGSDDPIRVMLGEERIEAIVARMFGFPNDAELDVALTNGISPDPDVPTVVRKLNSVHLSMYTDS